jgi:hypothetical protein
VERKPAFAAPRLLRHALRLLVLLGGTLVCWLLLTSAPAQADDSDASAGHHPVASGVDAVDTTTHAAADELRDASPQAERALTRATRSAPQPVRATVTHVVTTVGPAISRTTNAVADAVDRTVATVHGLVDPVVAGTPAVGGPAAAPAAVAVSKHPASGGRAHEASVPDASSLTLLATTSSGSRSGSADGSQLEPTRGLPVPGEPTAPAGSWTGPSPASATLAGMLLLLFLLLRGRRVRDDADLPSGPVYPPGSSPG